MGLGAQGGRRRPDHAAARGGGGGGGGAREHKVLTPRSAAAERAREAAAKAEAAAFGRVKGKQKSSGDLHEEWRRSSEGESVEWQARCRRRRAISREEPAAAGRAAYAEAPAAGPLVTVGAPTPASRWAMAAKAVILAEREEAASGRRPRRARRREPARR